MMLGVNLARERWPLLGWAAGLAVYFFVIGVSYTTVKQHEQGIDKLWSELPKPLREAFGNVTSITTPGGYFEARGTSLLPMVLGGAIAAHATRKLSGAEQAGELDLVLSLPIRRSDYLWAHWMAGLVRILVWLAASAGGAAAGMALAGVSQGTLLRIAFMVFEVLPFVLAVHAIAMWVGAGLHRRGPGTAIVAALLATWFLLQIVSSLDESLAWLRWLSPYAIWIQGDPFHFRSELAYLASCSILMATALPLAHRVWLRKDLKG